MGITTDGFGTIYKSGEGGSAAPAALLFGQLSAPQSTNIGPGDHVAFDNVITRMGSSISLDTTTPYTSTLGAASIGRVTLQPGFTYKLKGSLNRVDNGTHVYYGWFDATTGNPLGTLSRIDPAGGADQSSMSDSVAVITVSNSPMLIELQLIANTSHALGNTDVAALMPWFLVEQL